MSKADQRRFQRTYHSVVSILILFSGAALLTLGIWLTVSNRPNDLFNLDYVGDGGFFDVLLRTNVIAMILGGFLILAGVTALVALSRNWFGFTFRIIHFIMAILIFTLLAGICVAASLLTARRSDNGVKNFIRNAWTRTAKSEPSVICHIENSFECRGFNNLDCDGCLTGLEPACATVSDVCVECSNTEYEVDAKKGCYTKITSTLKDFLLPTAIIAGILAVVVFVDILFTFCLGSPKGAAQ